jgi:D-tyrosyl-tRNA(Tyr) deacylase
MLGVIQRVNGAEIHVEGECISRIGRGILLLVGIRADDAEKDVSFIADKTVNLRIFPDEEGNLNRSLLDVKGEALVVSQFTLLGDTRKGRRPSFSDAAKPERAEPLYRSLIGEISSRGVPVMEGKFRAMMEVKLVNSGPVTVIVNSKEKKWN